MRAGCYIGAMTEPGQDSEGRPSEAIENRRLAVLQGGRLALVPLPAAGTLRIGRASDCDVPLDDPLASREHAILECGAEVAIRDLDSANGTRLGTRRLPALVAVPLSPGQVVEVGRVLLWIQLPLPIATRPPPLSHPAFLAAVRRRLALGPVRVWRLPAPASAPDWLRAEPDPPPERGPAIGVYADGELEVVETTAAPSRLADWVGPVGRAESPRDGRIAEALVDVAELRRHGAAPEPPAPDAVVVVDPVMRELYRLAERAAAGADRVLLIGEPGVGKRVLAETLHRMSGRNEAPLETLDPERPELPSSGAVWVPRIEDWPPAAQAELARVLVERGADGPPIRVVASVRSDPEAAVRTGRLDPLLRLALTGLELVVPPLRRRPGDLDALARHFLGEAWARLGRRGHPSLGRRALETLAAHPWPGNLSELRHVLYRAAALAAGPRIDPEHLGPDALLAEGRRPGDARSADEAEPSTTGDASEERRRIIQTLERFGGNQTRAARALGISRRTLSTRLDQHDIPRPRKPRRA
jgi:two-component system response regulator AtoC